MNFRELLYMQMIFEERSITRAAEKLHIAQPSLSKFLSALESKQGYRIFDRSTTPLSLTEEGAEYLKTVRTILNLSQDLERKIGEIHDLQRGSLHVGIPMARAFYSLPEVLPRFMSLYPGIRIFITEAPASELEEQILQGKLDLIIIDGSVSSDELSGEVLTEVSLYLVTPPGYLDVRTSHRDILARVPQEKQKFVLLHRGQYFRELAEKIFLEYAMQPEVLLETQMADTAVKLCAQGLGMTFVSDFVKENVIFRISPDYYRLNERFSSPVSAFWRKNCYLPRAARPFIAVFKDYLLQPRP